MTWNVPIYTYSCATCSHVVEKRQSFSDPPLTTCEQCGGSLRKVIHPVGIVFKGSGWYVTDSRAASSNGAGAKAKKGGDESAPSKPSGSSEAGGGPASDAKPAASPGAPPSSSPATE